MMKRLTTLLAMLLTAGCLPTAKQQSAFDPMSVEWRQADVRTLTGDESRAVTLAKRHMADSIRGLKVAFDADHSADFSHVEFSLTGQTNGYKIAGRYIALYHSTGKRSGFPEGRFTLLVQPDGTVTNLHQGWE
jgi:hypothetical protein